MKKLILTSMLAVLTANTYSQNIFPSTGKVGIGNTSPIASLDIKSPINEIQLRLSAAQGGNSNSSIPSVIDFFSTFDKYSLDQTPRRTASIKGCFSGGTWGTETLSFHVGNGTSNDIASEPAERMRIQGNGYVGIGTTSPKELLSVNGNIRSREIKVEAVNWPDYVFESQYELASLSEIERFIKVNKHLPGIPTAKSIELNGVELGRMQALLLKNQEELVLHLIEKSKLIDKLEIENEALKKEQANIRTTLEVVLKKFSQIKKK